MLFLKARNNGTKVDFSEPIYLLKRYIADRKSTLGVMG